MTPRRSKQTWRPSQPLLSPTGLQIAVTEILHTRFFGAFSKPRRSLISSVCAVNYSPRCPNLFRKKKKCRDSDILKISFIFHLVQYDLESSSSVSKLSKISKVMWDSIFPFQPVFLLTHTLLYPTYTAGTTPSMKNGDIADVCQSWTKAHCFWERKFLRCLESEHEPYVYKMGYCSLGGIVHFPFKSMFVLSPYLLYEQFFPPSISFINQSSTATGRNGLLIQKIWLANNDHSGEGLILLFMYFFKQYLGL